MIWESIPLMTTVDVIVVVAATYVVFSFWRRRALILQSGATTGILFMLSGLTIIALFYASDLVSMHVAPAFIRHQNAMEIMRYLHLNIGWPAVLAAVLFVVVGLNFSKGSILSALERLSTSELRARLAELRLHDAIESMPGPILLCDDEGRITMCGPVQI